MFVIQVINASEESVTFYQQANHEGPMKGVVLAGGLGTRLSPLTRVTNKHLLPVYNKPMIYYPIQTLVNVGIREILLVTGGNNAGDFLKLLGNGKEFGLRHLDYTYQEGEGGIADALRLAEYFADGEPVCVVLGDNLIERHIVKAAQAFRDQKSRAKILLKEVKDPQRFGVPVLEETRVVNIEEKPKTPLPLRRDRHLFLRCRRLRDYQDAETLRPRRAGNHGREQCLHPRQAADLGCFGRLVDRCGHQRVSF